MIKIPNIIRSLSALACFQIGIHMSEDEDQKRFEVRRISRDCLSQIRHYGDLSAHTELVNARFVGALVIAISTASGSGEEYDREIIDGLYNIFDFLIGLHRGSNYRATFPPQPLHVRRSVEQIEEEGGNEEVDAQMNNKVQNIKYDAKRAKGRILNYFIEQGNTKPDWWYNW
ncbi:MAG: hypothetical protein EZS28_017592 [Streblomastix strix]|uniref:Uncharacterized protein n=1 Tax=Streblomastix strix TaxID=222440 RepID=A0A5J4VW17_9EUKA|nr:MAG: hypothetical protein EZS28_017592 [Streblomastix strix]